MTSESKATLYAKLAAVMGEMSGISKDGTNAYFKYKFVTADAVAEKVRQLLAAQKIAFFAAIVGKNLIEVGKATDAKTGDINVKYRWVVDFEFTFACGDSGATEIRPWSAEATSDDDKGINKCATAAEKYFLLKTFIVSTGDEPDADAGGERKRPQAAQNGAKGQRPPQQQQGAPSTTSVAQTSPLAGAPNGSPESTGTGSANGGSEPDGTPDADGYRRYLVHEIIVAEMPNGGRQYVAKSEIGDTIVTYGGDKFSDAGYDTSKWNANGKPNKVEPACIVEAKYDAAKKKWLIRSVEEAL